MARRGTASRPPRPRAAGAHERAVLVVEQPGQQQPVILDRVRDLGHMPGQRWVGTLGDGRDVGPDCDHRLGHGLHTVDPLLEGSDPTG
jgi:hypothetical protein